MRNLLAVIAGVCIAQLAAAWFVYMPMREEQGRLAGYAAAVDSVRAASVKPIRGTVFVRFIPVPRPTARAVDYEAIYYRAVGDTTEDR